MNKYNHKFMQEVDRLLQRHLELLAKQNLTTNLNEFIEQGKHDKEIQAEIKSCLDIPGTAYEKGVRLVHSMIKRNEVAVRKCNEICVKGLIDIYNCTTIQQTNFENKLRIIEEYPEETKEDLVRRIEEIKSYSKYIDKEYNKFRAELKERTEAHLKPCSDICFKEPEFAILKLFEHTDLTIKSGKLHVSSKNQETHTEIVNELDSIFQQANQYIKEDYTWHQNVLSEYAKAIDNIKLKRTEQLKNSLSVFSKTGDYVLKHSSNLIMGVGSAIRDKTKFNAGKLAVSMTLQSLIFTMHTAVLNPSIDYAKASPIYQVPVAQQAFDVVKNQLVDCSLDVNPCLIESSKTGAIKLQQLLATKEQPKTVSRGQSAGMSR